MLFSLLVAFAAFAHEMNSIERRRYLARIRGCNDCHTPGDPEAGGRVPESQWLIGTSLGWSGPRGTTYASNLRALLNGMSEDDWAALARSAESRPPMP
ncbi:MAG: hypothetical protein GWO02_07915 [Gammaproteobacteria bacterium]|nr:hypothetical protein [Gammaproteobacteria bacterium]